MYLYNQQIINNHTHISNNTIHRTHNKHTQRQKQTKTQTKHKHKATTKDIDKTENAAKHNTY